MNTKPTKDSGLIVAMYAGSHLYGTARPDSDIDIRGVTFPPPHTVLGLTGFEQFNPSGSAAIEYSKEQFGIESDDVTIYGLQKFFSLCLNANPNIIELLFAPDEAIIYKTAEWDRIVVYRDMFLSTKIVHSFSGYAYSQLKRIMRHKKWLDNVPEKPEPWDYGAVEVSGSWKWTVPTKDVIAALYLVTSSYEEFEHGLTSMYLAAHRKGEYEAAHKEWKHYETWRKNRNPARAELEKKYGYDTKHAMHLYRLFAEAEELLRFRYLQLPFVGWNQRRIMRILNGEVTYEEMITFARESHDVLAALAKESKLPKSPDRKGAERLLIGMMREWISTNSEKNTQE